MPTQHRSSLDPPGIYLSGSACDTLADAKRSATPLLAIVGGSDSIIPPERSRVLFDVWAGPKTWQVVPGGHNDLGRDDAF